jgi:hypothetical protein
MPDKGHLLGFYSGAEPDSRGRLLTEVQNWSDEELERTHDYIQWLFPLDEPSGFNMNAPILDASTIHEFASRIELRRNLRTSFLRMLSFYGMELLHSHPPRVVRAASFAERSRNWITPSNHNHLRITRILKSLRLLGLEAEAVALFECLVDIYRVEAAKAHRGISEETFQFWRSAVYR